MRVGVQDDLAFHLEAEAKNAVRSRMLRTEIHRKTLNLGHYCSPFS